MPNRVGRLTRRLAASAIVGVGLVALVWVHVSGRTSTAAAPRVRAVSSHVDITTSTELPAPTSPPSTLVPAAPPPSSARATGMCQTRLAQYVDGGNPYHVSLVAAYDARADDVARDDERQHGVGYRSGWRDRAAGEVEAVCWFDGDAFWTTPGREARSTGATKPPDRLEEIIRPDGAPVGYRAAHKDEVNPAPIASSDASS